MQPNALDGESQLVRGERLVLDLPDPRAVERVREVGAEGIEVEVVGALADLLVHGEGDAGRGARRVVADETGSGRDDHRDARLVVRAEQRRPVARHEIVALPLFEAGHVRRVQDLGRIAWKRDRLAGPGAVHDWPDARARRVRGRVDVCDQTYRRRTGNRARDRREDVAGLGELDLGEPDRPELLDEQPREVELLRGRGIRGRVQLRLGVDHHVAQETLEHLLGELLGERARVPRVSQRPRAAGAARPSSRGRHEALSPGCARSASAAATSGG